MDFLVKINFVVKMEILVRNWNFAWNENWNLGENRNPAQKLKFQWGKKFWSKIDFLLKMEILVRDKLKFMLGQMVAMEILAQNWNFGENRNLGQKLKFSDKKFWSKSKHWSKMEILVKKNKVRLKFRLKTEILVYKLRFHNFELWLIVISDAGAAADDAVKSNCAAVSKPVG